MLEVPQNWTVGGVGIGFPGPFDYPNGIARVRGVDKYEALYGVNLRDALETRLEGRRLPLRFANDAACALVAEARYGEGGCFERVIGVVLGTGMGSAFVVGGEQVTSGPSVPDDGYLYAEPFRGAPADEVFSTRGLTARLRRAGIEASIPAAASGARAGDRDLQAVFAAFGGDLATFLTPYAARFRADAVVLLGGIARTSDLFAAPLRQLPVPFYTSFLGDKAGVMGASLLF